MNVFPGGTPFESQAPWSAVTVWVTLSLFVQVTLVPFTMVNVAGLKEKLAILTLGALPLGEVAAGVCVKVLPDGVGTLLAGVAVAVGFVAPLVVVLPPQAARRARKVRMTRQNPAFLKMMEIVFCIF